MKSKALILIATLSVLCALAGCKAHAIEKTPTPVKIKDVERYSATSGVRYSASIVPRTQVELSFKVSGYVDSLHQAHGVDGHWRDVQEGDVIAKGTVLAQIRQSDYSVKVAQAESQAAQAQSGLDSSNAQLAEAQSSLASSKSQVAEAEAAYERAKLDYERAKNLYDSQSLTKADYDAAKFQYASAEAKLDTAKSQIAVANARINSAKSQIDSYAAKIKGAKAQVSEAVIPLQDTALRAPFNGVVLEKSVEVGTLASPGKAAFVIADTGSVKAIFGVPDMMVQKLKLGDALAITSEAGLGEDLRGQITAISPAADPKSRVFDIEVTIPNSKGLLKAGMIVSLTVGDTGGVAEVLVVPLSAIVKSKASEDSYAVFVVEGQGDKQIARSRNVKLGEAFGNTIAIIDGVKTGERVITVGATLVKDGEPVQVIP